MYQIIFGTTVSFSELFVFGFCLLLFSTSTHWSFVNTSYSFIMFSEPQNDPLVVGSSFNSKFDVQTAVSKYKVLSCRDLKLSRSNLETMYYVCCNMNCNFLLRIGHPWKKPDVWQVP